MNYNDIANIYTVSGKDDDMGGYSNEKKLVATIKCKIAPYTVKITNAAGIHSTHSRNELFTQNKDFAKDIENGIYGEFLIEHKGVMYKKITTMDAGKCLIIEMERTIE